MFAISDNKQPQPKEFFVGNAEDLEGCGAKLVSTIWNKQKMMYHLSYKYNVSNILTHSPPRFM